MDEPKMRRTLYSGFSANTCAYCALHRASLTPKQMKKHRCLAKGCTALIRHEHPYWETREESRQKRRDRKERMEKLYKEAIHEPQT